MMLLEHDAAIAFFISPLDHDEVVLSDLRGGVVLSALSGLSSEVRGGGWEGSWLHSEVFSKSIKQVLEDALLFVAQDCQEAVGEDKVLRRPSDALENFGPCDRGCIGVDQVNLSLRRLAMQAQADGMRSLLRKPGPRNFDEPRCSEAFMRAQVWLELVRLHLEGPPPDFSQELQRDPSRALSKEPGSFRRAPSGGRSSSAAPDRSSTSSSSPLWDDRRVISELGKPEADLEAESKNMSLDALTTQNRSIEAYLMRLVRQRDQLKHIAKLAEECDSYLILGLAGPGVTDEEVKKAYRELARKEHPDKAGTENKGRFQEIQQAYSQVLRRRRSSSRTGRDSASEGSSSIPLAPMQRTKSEDDEDEPSALIREVTARAELARDAADTMTILAHESFMIRAKGADVRGLQKKVAFRELQNLVRKNILHLRQGAFQLRNIKDNVKAVATGAETALVEYGEWADIAMAGAGLKERADVMTNVGDSCISTSEQLEKMGESDEGTLQKMEKASCEVDLANGARLLCDSLVRTATVVRCAADEAIGAATTALELGCSLAVLDRQRRADQAEQKKANEPWEQGDGSCHGGSSPSASGSKPTSTDVAESGAKDGAAEKPKKKKDSEESKDKKLDKPKSSSDSSDAPDGGGNTREAVKGKQAALRVRHLQCLGSLNDEVLALQSKLKELLGRSEGFLLPAVAPKQKDGVFDLVAQLLQSGLAEAAKLAADATLPSQQVLDRAFAFALALEHASEVALPAEVKTQALKLASMMDVDLLCEIIDGPFKRRLLCLEKLRPASLRDKKRTQKLHSDFFSGMQDSTPLSGPAPRTGRRSSSTGAVTGRPFANGGSGAGAVEAWSEAVHTLCARVVAGLRTPLQQDQPSPGGSGGDGGSPVAAAAPTEAGCESPRRAGRKGTAREK